MEQKRLKVFLIAFACEPHKGSEGGIGWNVTNQLARYHEVHVLTRANNRRPIEDFLQDKTDSVPVFHYYDLPRWLMFWKKKRRGYRLYYYLWLYFSYFRYRGFVKRGNFDIIHHLTFAQDSAPDLFVANNPGKGKTIWGPIGDCRAPEFIRRSMPWRVRIQEMFRIGVKKLLTGLDIMRIRTEKNADLLIAYPQDRASVQFRRPRKGQLIFYPQTGINPDEPEYRLPERNYPEHGTRLLICSEFMHWKGCTFAAEAFSRLAQNRRDITLDICGSGPEERTMRKIFSRYRVADRVRFHGIVPKQMMLFHLHSADVLLYPSYHHGLATVILQAMWAKLPIVALSGDFVASAVAEGAGLCASGETLDAAIRDVADKAARILDDPQLRRRMGERGRELIETKYSWSVLAAGMNRIYQQLVSGEPFDEYTDYSNHGA
ncbi:MAG: glycosyltransferase family 4 protein [Lentisphaeria bacterium]|nr:glycosyltransferase family 4 protein [Lentisphaeria bacterium]